MKQLQLTSTAICKECRQEVPFCIKICEETPDRVWQTERRFEEEENPSGISRKDGTTNNVTSNLPRIPAKRVTKMIFFCNKKAFSEGGAGLSATILPTELEHLTFTRSFSWNLEGVIWPPGLKRLEFTGIFNSTIDRLVPTLPAGVQELQFGRSFDQDVKHVVWPSGLKKLVLGASSDCKFNRPIDGVVLPAGLEFIKLSGKFDRPVDGVLWPARLKHLVFGGWFNQAIVRVAWPMCLETVVFGGAFNQEIEGVAWPSGLKKVQ